MTALFRNMLCATTLAVLTTANSLTTADIHAQSQETRCAAIKTSLDKLRGDLRDVRYNLTQARTPGERSRLQAEEAQLRQQAGQLIEMQTKLGCLKDLPGANVGPADSSAGGLSVDQPPTVSVDSTGATTGTTSPASTEVDATADDWVATWKFEFGTVTFRTRHDTEYVAHERLGANDAWGAKVDCDAKSVYEGDLSWDRAGGGYDRPFQADVLACSNGRFLEGKFSNIKTGGPYSPRNSASFRIALVKPDKSAFGGRLQPYDFESHPTGSATDWSGTK